MDNFSILGRGAFATVYRTYNAKLASYVACKRIRTQNNTLPTEIVREIAIYQRIFDQKSEPLADTDSYQGNYFEGKYAISADRKEEPVDKEEELGLAHIVRFLWVDVRNPRQIDLYLEYMSCGTLEMVLQYSDQLSSEKVRKWSHQISLGVEYLHRINIIHRDLKPGNIMVTTEEVLKIGDFGISQVHADHLPSTPLICTYSYRSPTILCQNLLDCRSRPILYGYEVDMWSLGCIIAEMARGTTLFTIRDVETNPIVTGLRQVRRVLELFEIPYKDNGYDAEVLNEACKKPICPTQRMLGLSGVEDHLIGLLQGLLVLHDETRLTAQQILDHQYFQ